MIELTEGLVPASPMPVPMRATMSWKKFPARAETAVIAANRIIE
ncbi:MAG: hypothetical protein WDM81_03790 [Rhizomicrobium sp.]